MLIEFFGIIVSLFIMFIFYYSITVFMKTINIKMPSFINNLDIMKWMSSSKKKEGMSNNDNEEDQNQDQDKDKDHDKDPLEKSIQDTQKFTKPPEAFMNKESSFLSFLTRFDPSFKPPNYTSFPYKSTLYTVDYKCRPSTTGMFTDCGAMASNSCK